MSQESSSILYFLDRLLRPTLEALSLSVLQRLPFVWELVCLKVQSESARDEQEAQTDRSVKVTACSS